MKLVFSFICTFLNTFENKLCPVKLKPENIVTDLRYRVEKKKKTLKEASQETEIDVKKGNCCNLIIINKLCLSVATTFIMKWSNNFVENVFRKFL